MPLDDAREQTKLTRRQALAVEATTGIPTDTLATIAALPPPLRPLALARAILKRTGNQ